MNHPKKFSGKQNLLHGSTTKPIQRSEFSYRQTCSQSLLILSNHDPTFLHSSLLPGHISLLGVRCLTQSTSHLGSSAIALSLEMLYLQPYIALALAPRCYTPSPIEMLYIQPYIALAPRCYSPSPSPISISLALYSPSPKPQPQLYLQPYIALALAPRCYIPIQPQPQPQPLCYISSPVQPQPQPQPLDSSPIQPQSQYLPYTNNARCYISTTFLGDSDSIIQCGYTKYMQSNNKRY